MNRFGSAAQRAAVCQAICSSIRVSDLWTASGPTMKARKLHHGNARALTDEERLLLRIAICVWDFSIEGPSVLEMMQDLSPARLREVGGLLQAYAGGELALHGWLLRRDPVIDHTATAIRRWLLARVRFWRKEFRRGLAGERTRLHWSEAAAQLQGAQWELVEFRRKRRTWGRRDAA